MFIKQTPGRKRHIVVDVLGILLVVVVHSAGVQDGSGGFQTLQVLFARIKCNLHNRWCRLKTDLGRWRICPNSQEGTYRFWLELGNCATTGGCHRISNLAKAVGR